MDELFIAHSARRHGVSDETILHAFAHPIRVEPLDDGFTMVIGPDPAGNLYEVGVVTSEDGPVIVHRTDQVPEEVRMPRSLGEILEDANELADRFENHEPNPDKIADATTLRSLREAFQDRVASERRLAEAVATARADGHSWAMIGNMIGTSGEAARQKYKQPAKIR